MKNTPAPLSRASEQRLLDCLDKAAELARDDSLDVNEVLAQAASQCRVPANHIHLLVNAYVTGKTAEARETGDTVWDKAASFPLPDAERVRALMYPATAKTAGEATQENAVSEDYSRDPMTWLRHRRRAKTVKEGRQALTQYSAEQPARKTKTHLPQTIQRRLDGDAKRKRRNADQARAKVSVALDAAEGALGELLEYFKSAQCIPFGEVFDNCLLLLGPDSLPVLDIAADGIGLERLRKQAAQTYQPARGLPYDLVAAILEAQKAHTVLLADWQQKEAEAQAAEEKAHPTPPGRLPPAKIAGVPIETVQEQKIAMDWRATGIMSNLAMAPMGAAITAPAAEYAKARAAAATARMFKDPKPDPRYQAAVTGLNREGFIYDLLKEHPGHDPHKVLLAYKELTGLAPRASTQEAVMKDFIRKRLEGGPLSYYDLESLTRIEKNLRDIGRDDEGPKRSM